VKTICRSVLICLLVAGLVSICLHARAQVQDGSLQTAHLGRCPLASGEVILDCNVTYRTFGTLNPDKTNAVIMPTWLNGRSDDLVSLFGSGPAALVDTSRFFGIAIDAFGDGLSSSPSNSTQQHGPAFPVFTMEDMARAQYRVMTDVLHLAHLHAVIGISMGGEQVFAWATLYPKYVDLAIPIVGTPQFTPFDLLSKHIVIDAIEADPAYQGGRYTTEPPLKLANEIGYQMVSAPQYRNANTQRDHFQQWFAEIQAPQRQDANDRVWQAKAILQHDVLHGKPLVKVAQATLPVRFLVIVAAQDRMVTPQPAIAWAAALRAPTYISPGACAHLIMNCDAEGVTPKVRAFLAQ
jgi:homoserine O-acetyltransferase